MTEKSHTEASAEVSSQAKIANDRPVYEVGFHILPTVAEDAVASVVEKIRTLLAKGDAEIIKEGAPVRHTLAYTIERSLTGKHEKYNESYFGFVKFAIDKDAVGSFMTALRTMNEVLRFLVIETVREETAVPRRAVFSSDRLEGETIKRPTAAPEVAAEVSDEELNKSLDALVS